MTINIRKQPTSALNPSNGSHGNKQTFEETPATSKQQKLSDKSKASQEPSQLEYLMNVVDQIFSTPFGTPVDTKKFPDYLDIVKRPMDLGTIRGNLLRNRYENASACIADINRVFTNCYFYNKPQYMVEEARKLEEQFLSLVADMPDEVCTSVKRNAPETITSSEIATKLSKVSETGSTNPTDTSTFTETSIPSADCSNAECTKLGPLDLEVPDPTIDTSRVSKMVEVPAAICNTSEVSKTTSKVPSSKHAETSKTTDPSKVTKAVEESPCVSDADLQVQSSCPKETNKTTNSLEVSKTRKSDPSKDTVKTSPGVSVADSQVLSSSPKETNNPSQICKTVTAAPAIFEDQSATGDEGDVERPDSPLPMVDIGSEHATKDEAAKSMKEHFIAVQAAILEQDNRLTKESVHQAKQQAPEQRTETTELLSQVSTPLPEIPMSVPKTTTSLQRMSTFLPQKSTSPPQTSTSPPQKSTSLQQTSTSLQQKSTYPPQTATSPPEKSTSLQQKSTSLQQKSTSLPQKPISLPEKSTSPPEQSTSLLQKSASLPQKSTSLPQKSKSPPEKSISLPQKSTTLPQKSTSLQPQTSTNVSLPKTSLNNYTHVTSGNVTKPVSGPSKKHTPSSGATFLSRLLSGNVHTASTHHSENSAKTQNKPLPTTKVSTTNHMPSSVQTESAPLSNDGIPVIVSKSSSSSVPVAVQHRPVSSANASTPMRGKNSSPSTPVIAQSCPVLAVASISMLRPNNPITSVPGVVKQRPVSSNTCTSVTVNNSRPSAPVIAQSNPVSAVASTPSLGSKKRSSSEPATIQHRPATSAIASAPIPRRASAPFPRKTSSSSTPLVAQSSSVSTVASTPVLGSKKRSYSEPVTIQHRRIPSAISSAPMTGKKSRSSTPVVVQSSTVAASTPILVSGIRKSSTSVPATIQHRPMPSAIASTPMSGSKNSSSVTYLLQQPAGLTAPTTIQSRPMFANASTPMTGMNSTSSAPVVILSSPVLACPITPMPGTNNSTSSAPIVILGSPVLANASTPIIGKNSSPSAPVVILSSPVSAYPSVPVTGSMNSNSVPTIIQQSAVPSAISSTPRQGTKNSSSSASVVILNSPVSASSSAPLTGKNYSSSTRVAVQSYPVSSTATIPMPGPKNINSSVPVIQQSTVPSAIATIPMTGSKNTTASAPGNISAPVPPTTPVNPTVSSINTNGTPASGTTSIALLQTNTLPINNSEGSNAEQLNHPSLLNNPEPVQPTSTVNPTQPSTNISKTSVSKPTESSGAYQGLLDSFQEELTCAICTEGLTDPKDLHCNHTFCKSCLKEWLKSQRNQMSIQCPVCTTDTSLKSAGNIDGLKTNKIIQNLANQVRSALAGSPPKSVCQIHEGMVVDTHCKTCDQLICEKCITICKRLHHAVEDRPKQRKSLTKEGSMHPLSERKRKCLGDIDQNKRRCIAWKGSVAQIKQQIQEYRDMLKEKIDKDFEKKMSDINNLEAHGDTVFVSYNNVMKDLLVEVSNVIQKKNDLKASVTRNQEAARKAYGNQAPTTTAQGQSQQVPSIVQGWPRQQGPGQVTGLPQQTFGQSQGWPQQTGTLQGWPTPAVSAQGWPQQIGAVQTPSTSQGWTRQHGPAQTMGPSQGWPRQAVPNPYQGRQTSRQLQGTPSIHDAIAMQLQQHDRALHANMENILRQPLPKLPSYQSVIFIRSDLHQQDYPTGQLVFHTCQ